MEKGSKSYQLGLVMEQDPAIVLHEQKFPWDINFIKFGDFCLLVVLLKHGQSKRNVEL